VHHVCSYCFSAPNTGNFRKQVNNHHRVKSPLPAISCKPNNYLARFNNMADKKTLILGATPDQSRYAYLAANRLVRSGHTIVNVGIKTGEVAGVAIEKPETIHTDIDTITLYVGPQKQESLYDYIIQTHPKRIIFNPGTENSHLRRLAHENGIATDYACTLVLLSIGQY
jgi:predicted CoA-binding protein